jgi:hypothetical protein
MMLHFAPAKAGANIEALVSPILESPQSPTLVDEATRGVDAQASLDATRTK